MSRPFVDAEVIGLPALLLAGEHWVSWAHFLAHDASALWPRAEASLAALDVCVHRGLVFVRALPLLSAFIRALTPPPLAPSPGADFYAACVRYIDDELQRSLPAPSAALFMPPVPQPSTHLPQPPSPSASVHEHERHVSALTAHVDALTLTLANARAALVSARVSLLERVRVPRSKEVTERDLFTSLPIELQVVILTLLPHEDVLNAALVSRTWHDVASSDTLWLPICSALAPSSSPSRRTSPSLPVLFSSWKAYTLAQMAMPTHDLSIKALAERLLSRGHIQAFAQVLVIESTIRSAKGGVHALQTPSWTSWTGAALAMEHAATSYITHGEKILEVAAQYALIARVIHESKYERRQTSKEDDNRIVNAFVGEYVRYWLSLSGDESDAALKSAEEASNEAFSFNLPPAELKELAKDLEQLSISPTKDETSSFSFSIDTSASTEPSLSDLGSFHFSISSSSTSTRTPLSRSIGRYGGSRYRAPSPEGSQSLRWSTRRSRLDSRKLFQSDEWSLSSADDVDKSPSSLFSDDEEHKKTPQFIVKVSGSLHVDSRTREKPVLFRAQRAVLKHLALAYHHLRLLLRRAQMIVESSKKARAPSKLLNAIHVLSSRLLRACDRYLCDSMSPHTPESDLTVPMIVDFRLEYFCPCCGGSGSGKFTNLVRVVRASAWVLEGSLSPSPQPLYEKAVNAYETVLTAAPSYHYGLHEMARLFARLGQEDHCAATLARYHSVMRGRGACLDDEDFDRYRLAGWFRKIVSDSKKLKKSGGGGGTGDDSDNSAPPSPHLPQQPSPTTSTRRIVRVKK